MAKPNKKGPSKTVGIFCSQCKAQLFKYRKGGKGALVKCFKERIVTDFCERIGLFEDDAVGRWFLAFFLGAGCARIGQFSDR